MQQHDITIEINEPADPAGSTSLAPLLSLIAAILKRHLQEHVESDQQPLDKAA